MKVAQILSSFGMGGQERVALDLSRGLMAHDCEVMAVAFADGPLRKEFELAGIPTAVELKGAGFDASLIFRLARLFRREKVKLVHTHNPQPLIYGAPAARLIGARVIHTKHGANPDTARRVLVRRAAALLCDAYVAVSPLTAAVARKNNEVPTRKLFIIQNGIDLSRFRPDPIVRAAVRKELGIPDGAWVVGTVGRLAPEKDQALLISVMAKKVGPDSRLVLVGDGPLANDLRQQASSAFIHFTGARSDTPRLYSAFDVFALSSVTEGLPLVLPEAMASELPMVSTKVGGIPDVIEEGVTGFLVPAGDVAAFAARLELLSANRPRAREMGKAARNTALERYSGERVVRGYLDLYRKSL